jgi:hypothetical protein
MRLIPYFKKKYKTTISKDVIFQRLEKMISQPDWELSVEKIINNRILEGELESSSFKLVRGRYALTYGRSSLLPLMMGKIEYDRKSFETIVTVVIRPSIIGTVGLSLVYFILVYSFFQEIRIRDMGAAFLSVLFFVVTYGSLIIKYNKEQKKYIELLETEILI